MTKLDQVPDKKTVHEMKGCNLRLEKETHEKIAKLKEKKDILEHLRGIVTREIDGLYDQLSR